MNCNTPTDICFSFTGFQARGGLTDVHKDGWGIAFFEGKGVRQFLDSQASAQSPVAELVRNYPIKSKNVIAHIRKATQGTVSLENTHPFTRELWGHYWIFAHNGNLIGFDPILNGSFRPVGQTDSEQVFCWILQELKVRFGDNYPGAQNVYETVHELALKAGAFGEFNFLFSNGEMLIAHCSTQLCYILRRAPFAQASLKDREVTIDFSSVTTTNDQVAIIATIPLTDNEKWSILEPGHLCLFRDGALLENRKTAPGKKNICTS